MKPGMPKLVAAVGTTLMDLAVIGYSGPLLWRVWGDVCLARIGLLMLAGGIDLHLNGYLGKGTSPYSFKNAQADGSRIGSVYPSVCHGRCRCLIR